MNNFPRSFSALYICYLLTLMFVFLFFFSAIKIERALGSKSHRCILKEQIEELKANAYFRRNN